MDKAKKKNTLRVKIISMGKAETGKVGLMVYVFFLCQVFLWALRHLKLDQKDLMSDQRALLEISGRHLMRPPSLNMAHLFKYTCMAYNEYENDRSDKLKLNISDRLQTHLLDCTTKVLPSM